MRIITRFLALSALLFAMLIPAGAATAAPAETVHGDTFVFAYNACNGEFVVGEGHYNFVFKQQKDGSYFVNYTIHGKGVGSEGNEYVRNINVKDRVEDFNNYSVDYRILAVSKGSAPNHWVKVHFDSQGNFTVEEDCRG